jgi:hypothetical protein
VNGAARRKQISMKAPNVGWRIILKWMMEEYDRVAYTEFTWLGIWTCDGLF